MKHKSSLNFGSEYKCPIREFHFTIKFLCVSLYGHSYNAHIITILAYIKLIVYESKKSSTGREVIKLFSCSTKLSTKFQLLIKTKIPVKADFFFALSLSDVVHVFIMLINFKMPAMFGI